MRIGVRLWLTGALLPVVALALALVVAVQVFRVALEHQLDRGLLAQAAVEGVSLFDAPDGGVHLHMEQSPLRAEVQPFAPAAVVYGPDGQRIVSFPQSAAGPARLDEQPPAEPRLTTERAAHGRHRVLLMSVRSPEGDRFALRLAASMAQIDAAAGLLARIGAGLLAAVAALLFGVQGLQARRMSRRLGSLETHMARVGTGHLDSLPAEDRGDDEISRLRDAIAEATRELDETRRARERLVADAAHELKTPLTNMRTAIDLGLRRERDATSLRATLEDTREEVDRLAHLSSHLLELSALASAPLRVSVVDLDALVREAAAGFAPEAERERVGIDVEAEAVVVDSDPVRLRQAVDNLLANALKFSPPGARVEVRVRREGARARIEVCDEGPGVPPDERESIFAPFHRTRDAPPGAGLGLAIVREVAERHGGRAFVEDRAPGSRFVLELPTS